MFSLTRLFILAPLLAACSGADPSPAPPANVSSDAGADAAHDAAPLPPPDGFSPPVTDDAGPGTTPCVQPPADTLPIGDDCFAYELADQCAPYECGRTVHYFCNGGAMPAADCHGIGTTHHGAATQGFCCTDAVCVRYKSGDALCPSGKVARSCPTVAANAPSGCTKVSASEKGDPIYCCGS